MKAAKIYDIKGKETSKKNLEPQVFEVEPKEVLLKQAVLRYLASLRESVAKTKTRAERRGGGKKPWRQKGTGRARAGSRRSPIWRKGGVIFGPTGKENFSKRMNKKALKKAILMALSTKANEDRVLIIDNIKLERPQTKKVNEIMKNLPIEGRIMLISDKDPILFKSFTNIPYVVPAVYSQLNAYDVMVADYVVIVKDVLPKISSVYGGLKEAPTPAKGGAGVPTASVGKVKEMPKEVKKTQPQSQKKKPPVKKSSKIGAKE